MANTDRAYGFVGFGPTLRMQEYSVIASYGTGIFIGDVCDGVSSGYVEASGATAVDKVGCAATYSAASTASSRANPMMILNHPDQLFQAQDDGDGTTSAISHIHNSCDHIAGTGSTTTLKSGHEIDISTVSASDGGFVLIELVKREDNAFGENADWVCQLNVGEGILTLNAGI